MLQKPYLDEHTSYAIIEAFESNVKGWVDHKNKTFEDNSPSSKFLNVVNASIEAEKNDKRNEALHSLAYRSIITLIPPILIGMGLVLYSSSFIPPVIYSLAVVGGIVIKNEYINPEIKEILNDWLFEKTNSFAERIKANAQLLKSSPIENVI